MSSRPRIVVFAYSEVGHACLKALLDRGENVVCVYTHEDNPDESLWFPSVAKLAAEHSLLVRTEELSGADRPPFSSHRPDLIFSFYYRNLIPKSILDLAPLGAFNMHGSLLPRYRGRAPINWAVLNGEEKTGATLHAMVEKADAGDIVDQEAVDIGPDDTAATVQSRVTKAAVTVLVRQLENLKSGRAPRIPQDSSKATVFGRRRPEDGSINWNWPAKRVHDLVRAVSRPYPGAFGMINGGKFRIWKSQLTNETAIVKNPGMVQVREKQTFVTCGDGKLLEIIEMQKEPINESINTRR